MKDFILKYWDEEKNIKYNNLLSEKRKFYFKCEKCKKSRLFSIKKRLEMATNLCNRCNKRMVSKAETQWLDSLKIKNLFRQYVIYIGKKKIFVDGFDLKTNTIFEYNGSYWHGDPKIYDPKKFNKKCRKTFGKLYEETLKREKLLLDNGYKLIIMWESDFKKLGEN